MKRFSLKYFLWAAPVFLGLLTFFYLKMREVDSADKDRFSRDLRKLKQIDTTLNQDILKARFHLLGDYDDFADELARLQENLRDLENPPLFVDRDQRVALGKRHQELLALVTEKGQLLDAFESQNAVLNNSLQYFPVAVNELSKRLTAQAETHDLELLLNDVVREVLVYSLTSSDEKAAEIRLSLGKIRIWRELHSSDRETAFLGTLMMHVESIVDRKPKVDALTRNLVVLPIASACEDYTHAWEQVLATAAQSADNYRRWLYIFSLLLVAGIAYALMALQANNRDLDRRVTERTRDLSASYSELQKEVAERKRTQADLEAAHKEIVEKSRQAGMAEVATSVLHNVGNVLNSVNVSVCMISDQIRKTSADSVAKVANLTQEHAADLGTFFTTDSKGRQLPNFLVQLAAQLAREKTFLLAETELLTKKVDHIKDIVATQQSYAKAPGVTEKVKLTELAEDALRMNASALIRHDVHVSREYAEGLSDVSVEKHKVLQILVNLIRNAKQACDETGSKDKQLAIRVTNGSNRVRIALQDNGVGIPAENLNLIFNHGFTTKRDGHGFGLHGSCLAAKEMGGSLTAHSEGPGKGATFVLELPCQPEG